MTEPRQFVKVSRHNEGIWLEVLEELPGGAVKAMIANDPVCWPQKRGDILWIARREIGHWEVQRA